MRKNWFRIDGARRSPAKASTPGRSAPGSLPCRERPRGLSAAILLLFALPLTSCVYWNTLFNGNKAYKMAERSRETRLRKNPDDTVAFTTAEGDLYRRAIAKGSKVIEQFPKKVKYHDDAILLIAHSFQRLGEWTRALKKFDEFIDFFPQSDLLNTAVQGKIETLIALERFEEAEEWMSRLDSLSISGGPAGLAWIRAQIALGRLDSLGARRELAFMLSLPRVPQRRRVEAVWLLGRLQYQGRLWAEARPTLVRPETDKLLRQQRYKARLWAALSLLRTGDDAGFAELEALENDPIFDRERPLTLLEHGLALFEKERWEQGVGVLERLTQHTQPPEVVAEGLLRLGLDAQNRRIDYRLARKWYDQAAAAGPNTVPGKRARELSDALGALALLREKRVADTARADWNFDLAELFLFRLDNRDSAKAAYARVASDSLAPRPARARAQYALAWIEAEAAGDSTASQGWLAVAERFPGTEFAKQAQRNAGVPVTERTVEDTAEAAYAEAEKLWYEPPHRPEAAIGSYREIARLWPRTQAGRRALFAIAWLQDQELADSAGASASYQIVVDSLPGTAWAARARDVLAGQPREFRLSGQDGQNDGEPTIIEEQLEGRELRPRQTKPPRLESQEPDPIPPEPGLDEWLTPEQFE